VSENEVRQHSTRRDGDSERGRARGERVQDRRGEGEEEGVRDSTGWDESVEEGEGSHIGREREGREGREGRRSRA